MINTRKLLGLMKKSSKDKENLNKDDFRLEEIDIDKIIDEVMCFGNHKYIICESDIIEISGFYHEVIYEFFVPAFSIKVNDELLYSGYKECGSTTYIDGKFLEKEEALEELKNILKEKSFKISKLKDNKVKDYER